MKISDCIAPQNVAIGLDAPSKTRLLHVLAEKAGRATGLDERAIFAALQSRETLGSTGIGAGIALPHAPVAGLKAPFGLIARLARPIGFDAIDGLPVDLVCLVLSPPESTGAHLTVLARIARLLRSADLRNKARTAASAEQLYAVITSADG